nr:photosystem I reaction center subunit M [Gayralia brasiliensis]YP_010733734.1 photosystem I reaction center subunit M [Monostroma nitidum]WEG92931.1 photosystem I reaction center subunit M [Gayralia brasiliensis]WEG93005.1 photosystem I reaction center subunit M [Monostroma nitidum]
MVTDNQIFIALLLSLISATRNCELDV